MNEVIEVIDRQIEKLQQARRLILEALGVSVADTRSSSSYAPRSVSAPGAPKKRQMSPEARERIAAAQRKRWAVDKANKAAEVKAMLGIPTGKPATKKAAKRAVK